MLHALFCEEELPLNGSGYSRAWVKYVKEEFHQIFPLMWPVSLSSLLGQSIFLVNIYVVGAHLSTVELSAVALAMSYVNVFGRSNLYGLATAYDTLASQAFGSTNKKLVGLQLQRGVLILLLTCLPCWALFINAERILLMAHQDPTVSKLAGQFCLATTPMLISETFDIMFETYLHGQGITVLSFLVGVVVNVLNYFITHYFIVTLKMGVVGSALALTASYTLAPLLTLVYILWTGMYKETWPGFSRKAFRGWDEFLKLGLPGMLMVCSEWWSFEIVQFLAGLFGPEALAAQSISLQIAATLSMTPLGVGIASQIRVGNALGAGQINAAKLAAQVSLFIAVVIFLIQGSILFSARDFLSTLFSNDKIVIKLVKHILFLVGFFQIFDATQIIAGGILRGCGRQKIGAWANIIAFYVVGLPAGAYFAFYLQFGVIGLYTGMLLALFIQFSVFLVAVHRTDWITQAKDAQQRCEEDVEEHTFEEQYVDHLPFMESKDMFLGYSSFRISGSNMYFLFCTISFLIGLVIFNG